MTTKLKHSPSERNRETAPVQIEKEIKNKVAKYVAGTNQTIGNFFGDAAEKELKKLKQ